jgi:hypothetical protein
MGRSNCGILANMSGGRWDLRPPARSIAIQKSDEGLFLTPRLVSHSSNERNYR